MPRAPLFVPLALLTLCTCVRPPSRRAAAARLVETTIDPPPGADGRVARLPRVALVFDRWLAPLHPDAVWLVSGPPSASLRTDASRGGLGSTNAARRLEARVWLDADEPERVVLEPVAPLLPGSVVAVATTARLVTVDGAPVGPAEGPPGPLVHALTVAAAPDCPPLARLRFPLPDAAPRALGRIVVGFDRPLWPPPDGGRAAELRDPDGAQVPAAVSLGCGDDAGGFLCVQLSPRVVLAAEATHRVALGALRDADGRAPQAVDLAFRTGEARSPPPAPASAPLACAADELARPPFCMRLSARGLALRGVTAAPGALRARAGTTVAESAAGTSHEVLLEPLPPETELDLFAWTVALDGSVTEAFELEPVTTAPAAPALRIAEVLARPFSSSAQEFVEVVNVGDAPADLAGLRLVTPSGASVLPSAVVDPGARAVIVGAAFDPRGVPRAGDPAVAPGATVVRLGSPLASRGLSDRGADVWLADAEGRVISRAPTGDAARPPRQGVSLCLADARMKEDDPAAWSYDSAGGSTPGAADRVR